MKGEEEEHWSIYYKKIAEEKQLKVDGGMRNRRMRRGRRSRRGRLRKLLKINLAVGGGGEDER